MSKIIFCLLALSTSIWSKTVILKGIDNKSHQCQLNILVSAKNRSSLTITTSYMDSEVLTLKKHKLQKRRTHRLSLDPDDPVFFGQAATPEGLLSVYLPLDFKKFYFEMKRLNSSRLRVCKKLKVTRF